MNFSLFRAFSIPSILHERLELRWTVLSELESLLVAKGESVKFVALLLVEPVGVLRPDEAAVFVFNGFRFLEGLPFMLCTINVWR